MSDKLQFVAGFKVCYFNDSQRNLSINRRLSDRLHVDSRS